MKFFIVICLLITIILVSVFMVQSKSKKNFDSVHSQGSLIVDVRSEEEFISGHSVKSINIPLEKIEENRSIFLNTDKSKIILVCKTGTRAENAKKILIKLGVKKEIINIGDWQNLDY